MDAGRLLDLSDGEPGGCCCCNGVPVDGDDPADMWLSRSLGLAMKQLEGL